MLDDLIARVEAGETSTEEAAQEAPLHRGDSVAVTIHLTENVDGVVDFLEANGASSISSSDDYIEAYVPVLKLAETGEQPGVLRVRVIQPPQVPQSQSQVAGDGPGVHGSPAWNRAGYTGTGIKVGIIDSGFSGFVSLMGSEVPVTVQARCYRWVGAHSQDVKDCEDGGNHGTQVAESVIDIAPDVSLYIADPVTLGDLKNTVDWMISEDVSVINHSMTWLFDGPGDGTSPSSISPLNTVDRAVAAGIVWVNAAGNEARKAWFKRGPFSYSTITVDGEEMRVINFDGSNFTNRFHLSGPLQLRWDDTWGGATSDLNLLLVRPDETEIEPASIDPQSGGVGHNPYESVSPGYSLTYFNVMVAHNSGSEPDWIQLLGWSWANLQYNTPETGSIGNPSESVGPGMLTVGAAHWGSVDTIRYYSSRGPTPNGSVKPDMVGADCGDTSVSENAFCGTSQASPHVAGLAALVRQRFPDYTPAQVASYLKDNAQQRINSPDPNNTWGHGFIVLPPNPPQYFGPPSIDSVTPDTNTLTITWSAPASDGGSAITAYDLRHIQSDATDKSDSDWTVVQDVWTGSGALSFELNGLTAGTQYDMQARAVNATGDGPWSTTATGTPTIAPTPCFTGGAVPNPHDNLELVADCDILLAARDTLAGSGTLNWATSTPIANWIGVTVSGTPQRVTVLYLGIRGLSGTIPVELGRLTGLTQMSIFGTQVTGPIPTELRSLTNLTALNLFSNRLTGQIPKELGRLTNLQDLSLYDNQLTGTIPSELANLTGLKALHVDTNELSGPIPTGLGSLTNLRWLTLHDNQLTGEIPSGLERLTNLEQVWLAGNRFTGCVPAELRSVASTDPTHRLKEIGIPYCDVLLSGLSITAAELRPEFDPYVTRYTAAATAASVTISPTSQHNATFQYLDQYDGVLADTDGTQAGHQVDVPAGVVTTIRVRVTTADGLDSRIYTIEFTGLGGLSAPSISQITSGVSSLTVSWREPSQTGGSAITAYDLRHIRSDAASKADSNWTVVQDVWTGSGTLSYGLASLQGGVQYDIQVRAVNVTGDGPWSATVSQTARGTVPGAPTGLAATVNGQTQIDLSWSTPQNTGSGTITGYRIDVSPDGSSWSYLVADTRSTTTSYSHTGLTASSTRHYRVSAINSEGTGPASNVANATTGATLAPDLVVDTPTVGTSAPVAGASFTVSATVRNQGNGLSDSTTLRYYQSTDSTITTSDMAVGTDSVFRLNASGSGNESINLTTPSTPGTYYYGACVDAVTAESDTTNNCSSAVAVTVGAAPAPDLVVDAPTVSDSAPTAGARITLNATVRNQGNGRSDSTTLRYYQSTDSTITTSDMAVGTDSVFRLNASGSGNESINLTTPSTPGTYYYGACVDAVTAESDTTNNCSSAVAVTVGAAPAPDLVVDAPTVSDSAPTAGARITLNATVRNQGNGRSDSTTLRYYQSTDSTITTSDMAVGTDSVFWLSASRSGSESISLTTPSTPGTYYYGACVDAVTGESDTTNNCSSAVAVTVGAAPAPDLVVDTPTVSDSAPTAGARITLNTTVRNQGNGRSDATTLRYYQSADSTITTSDTQVDTDNVSILAASRGGNESVSLTAPSTLGTYYYGACVDAVTAESDTTNNCSAAVTVTVGAAPVPDLVVDAPTVSDSAPTAGARITLNATVRNQGNGRSDSTTLRYYLSTDSTITTGDTEVDTDNVSILAASRSGNESVSLTAPSTLGTYYYGACVDAVTAESDTTNNCSSGIQVTVGAAPAPDLVVDAPTVSDNAPMAGARITLNTRVRNQGNRKSDSTTLWWYQSTDSTITTGDTVVGSDSVAFWFGIAVSSSYAEDAVLTAPSTPGTYYYGACVDAVTGESDTTNNCSTAVTVTVGAAPAPDLVVDTPTVSDSAPTAGARITLNATVRNQGNGRSDSTTLRYYQSADSTITTGDSEIDTDSVFGLDASEGGDESISLTAPSTPGTSYYGACVDAVTGESDTTNNCSSAVSVTVGAVPAPVNAPGAPTGLTATPNGQTEIDLSWTAPSNNGGAAITGYKIEVSTNGSSWSDLVSNTRSTAASYSHTNLTAGSTRYYLVSAINSVGTGQASNTANATTDTATASRIEVSTCTTGSAVSDAAGNPGLVADCEVLLAARDTLAGTGTLNWSPSTPIANWVAVTVSGRPPRVTKIDTSGENLNLSGTIPSELGNLSELTTLRLSNNKLTGSIPPQLGNLTNLEWLSLWNNELTGSIPSELGSLSNLTLLRLEWNELTGTIPAQLGNLTKLESLYLGGNRLTGVIPSELGRLTKLRGLVLGGSNSGGNQLTGTVPTELKNLTKLQAFGLWNNRISGTIPTWLGSLADLRTLNLAGNELTGTIPTELGSLNKVTQFWLQGNQLTGTIPTELGSLTNVTELLLDSNRITGTIPIELSGLTKLRQLQLSNNQLTGCIPVGLRDVRQNDLALLSLPDCGSASQATTTPDAPTSLTTTANGQTQIDLSWTAPSDNGGASITGYKIEVSTDNSSWSDLVANTGSTATSYSHTGLTAGNTRYYRVSAINSAGAGTASSVANATTDSPPAATAPGAPTGLSATANGQTQIDLSWTAPSDNGGASITGYRIEVSTDNSSWNDLVADTGSIATSYSHTGLTAGSTRYYRVSAINSAGAGTASSVANATTDSPPAATAPGAPTGLSATANSQTQIDLSWTAPSDNGGASITSYRIEVSTDNSSWSDLVANTASTATSYSHTGLMAGSTRYYRVSAINSVGTSSASTSDSATTDEEPASDGTCTVNLIVEPGENCTYPGTSAEFSVDSSGSGSFLVFSSGSKIEIRNSTINGVTYTFVASKQSSGNWLVEEVG